MTDDNDPYYEPFDQEEWLPAPPWQPGDPALIAWEKAHGHDVRLKCYVEYGCQVVESSLERQLAAMTAERDELAIELHCIEEASREMKLARVAALLAVQTPLSFQEAMDLILRTAGIFEERDKARAEASNLRQRLASILNIPIEAVAVGPDRSARR